MKYKAKTVCYILLIASLTTGTASQSYAQPLDRGFAATYEVHHTEFYLGDTFRQLSRQDNGSWIYRSNTEPKGLASAFVSDKINEISKIRKINNQFQPDSYNYHQHGGKKEVVFNLTFDWQANQLSNSYKNKTYPLEPGTHDLLSFQIQLINDMQAGKKSVSYIIADKKRVDTYHLKQTLTEEIETPMKTFSAVKLVSNKIRNKMQFIIWCAPELSYLPVKVLKIDKKGRESVLLLKSVKF